MNARRTSRQPFSLVPWEQDFLEALADELIRDYALDLGQALIIFPHARPARYLRRILAARPDLPKPCLLPAMYALPRFISDLAAEVARIVRLSTSPEDCRAKVTTLLSNIS